MPPADKKRLSRSTLSRASANDAELSGRSLPAPPLQLQAKAPIQREGNGQIEQSFLDDFKNFVEVKTGTADFQQPSQAEKDLKAAQAQLKKVKDPIDQAIKVMGKAEEMAGPSSKSRISSMKGKMSSLSGLLGKADSYISDAETLLRIVRIFKAVQFADPAKDPVHFALVMDQTFSLGGELLAKSPHPVLGELGKFLKAGGDSNFFLNMHSALSPAERYKHEARTGEGIQNEKELRDAAMSKGMDGMEEIKGTKGLR